MPSAITPGIQFPAARLEMSAIFEDSVVLIPTAYWLFLHTKRRGTERPATSFNDSWNVPWLDAPSPRNDTAKRPFFTSLEESTAHRELHAARVDPICSENPDLGGGQMHGSAFAFVVPYFFPETLRHHAVPCSALRNPVTVPAMRARYLVLRLEVGLRAHCARLLSYREVHETRQIARSEKFLHLFLENADGTHLPIHVLSE